MLFTCILWKGIHETSIVVNVIQQRAWSDFIAPVSQPFQYFIMPFIDDLLLGFISIDDSRFQFGFAPWLVKEKTEQRQVSDIVGISF